MNWKTVGILSIIGYVGYRLMQAVNTVDQLRYFVRKVKYNKSNSTAFRTALVVTLGIENPTRNSVQFNRFVGTVKIKGTEVTRIEVNGDLRPITFKPGTTDVEMDCIISHASVIQLLPGILAQLRTGGLTDLLQITGTLYAGGLTIPINQQIQLSF